MKDYAKYYPRYVDILLLDTLVIVDLSVKKEC